MPEPVIRFQGVSKSYGGARVLREIDFEIRAGHAVGLAGVNGAGKTTLIKCLLDFCQIDAGTIEINGIGHQRPESRARLAYLPERFVPPYFLTGREFLDAMRDLSGARRDAGLERSILESLDLDAGALRKPVRTHSKGTTQRLGLAACFASDRDVYVLDEPMGGLDPRARAAVKRVLRQQKSAGRTVFLTAHSLADIEEICDHMAVLHNGRLAYYGPPAGLLDLHGESTLESAFLRCIENTNGECCRA
jgi:ABC-2 type transport system ATP-binding protein